MESQKMPISSPKLASPMKLGLALSGAPSSAGAAAARAAASVHRAVGSAIGRISYRPTVMRIRRLQAPPRLAVHHGVPQRSARRCGGGAGGSGGGKRPLGSHRHCGTTVRLRIPIISLQWAHDLGQPSRAMIVQNRWIWRPRVSGRFRSRPCSVSGGFSRRGFRCWGQPPVAAVSEACAPSSRRPMRET